MSRADRQDTNKVRINALDISVIFIALILIVTAVIRTGVIDKITFSSKEYKVVILIENADYGFAPQLSDSAVFTEDDNELGSVENYTLTRSEMKVTDAEGNLISVPYPEDTVQDICITLSCRLGVEDGRFVLASGEVLTVGTEMSLHTASCVFSGRVLSVS